MTMKNLGFAYFYKKVDIIRKFAICYAIHLLAIQMLEKITLGLKEGFILKPFLILEVKK
jgi:hypothetical protein